MNLRRALQSRLPGRDQVSSHRMLRWLGHRLHDPNLWHFGRRSVSRAAGVGMLVAFFPIPIHMTMVAPIALVLGINLPVMVAAVWVTNPITWVPIFYFAYRVGAWFVGEAPRSLDSLDLHVNLSSLGHAFGEIWLPLCVGSAVCGVVAGTLTYGLVEGVWRFSVARRWRRRLASHRARGASGSARN